MTGSSALSRIDGRTLIRWCGWAVFAGMIIGAFIYGARAGHRAAVRDTASAIESDAVR